MDGTVWIHLDVDAPNAIFGFDSGEVYADADVRCFSPKNKKTKERKKKIVTMDIAPDYWPPAIGIKAPHVTNKDQKERWITMLAGA